MSTPRDTLLAEASSLNITVNPKWGDKRLQEEIDKALAAPPAPPALPAAPNQVPQQASDDAGVPGSQSPDPANVPPKESVRLKPTILNRLEFLGSKGASVIIEPGPAEGRIVEITEKHLGDPHLMAQLKRAVEVGILIRV